MAGIFIAGTGSYLPEKIITNEDFTKLVDTSDEWIRTRTGMQQRHVSSGEPTWYMAAKAAENALENAGISAVEIDLIVLSTVTSDYISPSLSCIVQQRIGAVNSFCMDINCACSGFVNGLDVVYRYLQGGEVKNALLISAERLSKITDYTDRSTCVLFGDGAGAAVVRSSAGSYSSYLGADGTGQGALFAENLTPKTPFEEEEVIQRYRLPQQENSRGCYLYQDGRSVYRFATNIMPKAVKGACEKAGVSLEELDWIIPHQANIRIIETAAAKLKFPLEKVYVNIEKYGNTSSATIALCLDEMNRNGLLKRGQKIAVVGFGAGLTYAAAVFEW